MDVSQFLVIAGVSLFGAAAAYGAWLISALLRRPARADVTAAAISGLAEEVAALSHRLSGMARLVEALPRDAATRGDVTALTGALEPLAGRVAAIADALPPEEERRDTADALARIEAVLNARPDTGDALGRIEARLAGLAEAPDTATLEAILDARSERLAHALGAVIDSREEARATARSAVDARIAALADDLSTLPQTLSRLGTLTEALAGGPAEGALGGRLDVLEGQLKALAEDDPADRVIARLDALSARLGDPGALDGRLDVLERELRALAAHDPAAPVVARLDTLEGRVGELAGRDAAAPVLERLDSLAAGLEAALPAPAVAERLDMLSARLAALDGTDPAAPLIARLDALAARLDAGATPSPARPQWPVPAARAGTGPAISAGAAPDRPRAIEPAPPPPVAPAATDGAGDADCGPQVPQQRGAGTGGRHAPRSPWAAPEDPAPAPLWPRPAASAGFGPAAPDADGPQGGMRQDGVIAFSRPPGRGAAAPDSRPAPSGLPARGRER